MRDMIRLYTRVSALFGLLCSPSLAASQIFAAAPVPAVKPSPEQPVAELKIFSAGSQRVKWEGEGANTISYDLCVASSTGRFRLQVTSQGGGALLGANGKLRFSIRFRDGTGAQQVKSLDGQSFVTFEGAAPAQRDCSAGANATIEVDSSESDLLAQAAGDYADRLLLAAEPL